MPRRTDFFIPKKREVLVRKILVHTTSPVSSDVTEDLLDTMLESYENELADYLAEALTRSNLVNFSPKPPIRTFPEWVRQAVHDWGNCNNA